MSITNSQYPDAIPVVMCPRHTSEPHKVALYQRRTASDGRRFARGTCGLCGWRSVKMLPERNQAK